jgi:hypothetical protein
LYFSLVCTLFSPTATQGFHPFITEGCYRALLYAPSLPNTPFAECISVDCKLIKKKKFFCYITGRCLMMVCLFIKPIPEVTLRSTVSLPVSLGVRRPSGTHDQFYFLLEIFFRQLRFCNFNFLTRERVCNLLVQLLLGLARAVTLGSKSRRTHGHILQSHLRLPEPGGPVSRIYIPQEQGGPVIPPGTGFPFCRLLRLAETIVEVF